jgi:hypothetical protein
LGWGKEYGGALEGKKGGRKSDDVGEGNEGGRRKEAEEAEGKG